MLPPGRTQLATSPACTGSVLVMMTIGIVLVARWAARVVACPRGFRVGMMEAQDTINRDEL